MSTSQASFDELWRFYRNSGFVYQAKELKLQPYLAAIENTWAKLLQSGQEVFRLFTNTRGGHIKSALAITRYYQSSWMVHHMASLADPWGMKLILGRAIKWMMTNEELDHGIFYWRPENGRADVRFSNLGKFLGKARAAGSTQNLYDYFYFPVKGGAAAPPCKAARIHSVPVEQRREVLKLLGRVLSPHEMSLRSLNPEDLTLERLDNMYRSHGLDRTREAYYAETGGRIQAVALLEKASLGLNFSHFFNKFHLYFVGGDLDRAGKVGVLSQVLAFLLSRCREDGQDFLVCLCESELSGLFQALGYRSQKRYACMSIARNLEDSLTLQHFDKFYERRMRAGA